MSMSRSALDVKLERWEIEELIDEIEELIDVLQDKMHRAADKQDYYDADGYKRRVAELREILKTPMPAPDSV